MRRSKFYNMRLPERGAREGEANDAADIEDLTYDLEIIDKEMERQRLEDVRMEKEKATKLELSQHKSAAVLDHPDNSVTDAKLGQRTVLTTSGPLQTLLTAIGNAIKAISGADTWNGTPATTLKDAKTHMGDAVKHITAQERESWNTAATDRHSHTNKSVLDGITAAMVTAWNTVSSKLPLAGGTLTGFLTLHAAPATDMHAATKKYVDDKMAASGSGDMTKAVYDPGGRELPYIPKQDVDALAWGGDFGASGTPVSIAYAGAQRIAAITAYGENAQGGTTEAPVALTGVDSVFVGGRNLLPMATETKTLNGVTFTPNPDGSVLVSGTATDYAAVYVFADGLDESLLGQTVCLSAGSMQAQLIINEKKPTGEWIRNVLISAHTPSAAGILSKQAEANILYATIYVPAGTTVNTTVYPMLNLSESPLPYEPYQGSVTQLPIPRPLRRVGDIKDKCVTRQDYESAEKLVVTYNVGFVELDGTEDVVFDTYGNTQKRIRFDLDRNAIARYALKFSHGNPGDTPTVTGGISASFNRDVLNRLQIIGIADTWTALGVTDTATAKTWLAAQKEAGTPVQIAYQLATPEVYATDPVDFDNAAGPLTVMTGGEVVVRMTELVGSRSPELTAKMDKATYDADGDGVVDRAGSVDGGTY